MNTVATLSKAEPGVVTDHLERHAVVPGYVWASAIAIVFAALICVWHACDYRVPGTDEAGHILNSLQYKELWRHPRLWKGEWWHAFLTVNQFYPPALYAFNGALKLIFGMSRWVDTASLAFFSVVLTLSAYGITRLISRSEGAALVAALAINLYPELVWLSHYYMLDFPLVAMYAAALWSMLSLNERPSWKRSAIAAIIVTLACMTKQIVAGYLILPGLWLLYRAAQAPPLRRGGLGFVGAAPAPPLQSGGADFVGAAPAPPSQSGGLGFVGAAPAPPGDRFSAVAQVLVIPAVVLAAAVPWFAANWQWIHSYSQENMRAMQASGALISPLAAFLEYANGVTHCMSPLLLFAFVCSLFLTNRETHRRLIPIYASALGGLLALSFISWQPPLDRYVAPALLCTAIVTGCGGFKILMSGMNGRAPAIALMLLSIAQLISFSFTSYPIEQPRWFALLAANLGVSLREYRGVRIDNSPPLRPTLDLGQQWVVEQIKAVDGNIPVWLNILPSDTTYNPHSFELLAKESGMSMRPTTSRLWTITGDKVDFDPKTARYYHWYLLKTGPQGNPFCDQQSEVNYRQLIDFVQHSGHFRLVSQHSLPHGATLLLYRQTP